MYELNCNQHAAQKYVGVSDRFLSDRFLKNIWVSLVNLPNNVRVGAING